MLERVFHFLSYKVYFVYDVSLLYTINKAPKGPGANLRLKISDCIV